MSVLLLWELRKSSWENFLRFCLSHQECRQRNKMALDLLDSLVFVFGCQAKKKSCDCTHLEKIRIPCKIRGNRTWNNRMQASRFLQLPLEDRIVPTRCEWINELQPQQINTERWKCTRVLTFRVMRHKEYMEIHFKGGKAHSINK